MIKSLVPLLAAERRRLRDGSRLAGVTASMMYAGDWPTCVPCISERRVLHWMW